MSKWKSWVGPLHGQIAKSQIGLFCAVKLHNQCHGIIERANGGSYPQHERNGEEMLTAALAGKLRYFVDVGANRGSWTNLMRKYQSSTALGLLFEPSNSALAILRQRFGDDPGIEIIPAAVGDAEGEAFFNEEADAGETSSIVAHHSGNVLHRRSVSVTTVDAEVERHGWPQIDFLKIDAEGYDFQVLLGARSTLASRRVLIGQFEYGPAWRHAGSTLSRALDFLDGHGYTSLLLTRKGLSAPRVEWYGEYFGYSNYVFCRADANALVADLLVH